MEKEIQEIIEKQLPKQVGEALQKRLQELEKKEQENTQLLKNVEKLEKENKRLDDNLYQHSQLDIKIKQSEEKLKEIAEKEFKLENTLLKTQLDEANKRADIVVGFMNGLVRNTEFRRDIYDNENKPYIDHNGYQQYSNTTKVLNQTDKVE